MAAMEVLACCLLDPGDVVLTPSPCYTRIFVNFSERFKVSVVDVLLRDTNEVSPSLQKHFQHLGAQAASCTMGTGPKWLGPEANLHILPRLGCLELYPHFLLRLCGVVQGQLYFLLSNKHEGTQKLPVG